MKYLTVVPMLNAEKRIGIISLVLLLSMMIILLSIYHFRTVLLHHEWNESNEQWKKRNEDRMLWESGRIPSFLSNNNQWAWPDTFSHELTEFLNTIKEPGDSRCNSNRIVWGSEFTDQVESGLIPIRTSPKYNNTPGRLSWSFSTIKSEADRYKKYKEKISDHSSKDKALEDTIGSQKCNIFTFFAERLELRLKNAIEKHAKNTNGVELTAEDFSRLLTTSFGLKNQHQESIAGNKDFPLRISYVYLATLSHDRVIFPGERIEKYKEYDFRERPWGLIHSKRMFDDQRKINPQADGNEELQHLKEKMATLFTLDETSPISEEFSCFITTPYKDIQPNVGLSRTISCYFFKEKKAKNQDVSHYTPYVMGIDLVWDNNSDPMGIASIKTLQNEHAKSMLTAGKYLTLIRVYKENSTLLHSIISILVLLISLIYVSKSRRLGHYRLFKVSRQSVDGEECYLDSYHNDTQIQTGSLLGIFGLILSMRSLVRKWRPVRNDHDKKIEIGSAYRGRDTWALFKLYHFNFNLVFLNFTLSIPQLIPTAWAKISYGEEKAPNVDLINSTGLPIHDEIAKKDLLENKICDLLMHHNRHDLTFDLFSDKRSTASQTPTAVFEAGYGKTLKTLPTNFCEIVDYGYKRLYLTSSNFKLIDQLMEGRRVSHVLTSQQLRAIFDNQTELSCMLYSSTPLSIDRYILFDSYEDYQNFIDCYSDDLSKLEGHHLQRNRQPNRLFKIVVKDVNFTNDSHTLSYICQETTNFIIINSDLVVCIESLHLIGKELLHLRSDNRKSIHIGHYISQTKHDLDFYCTLLSRIKNTTGIEPDGSDKDPTLKNQRRSSTKTV